jgi:hypothetical protein
MDKASKDLQTEIRIRAITRMASLRVMENIFGALEAFSRGSSRLVCVLARELGRKVRVKVTNTRENG